MTFVYNTIHLFISLYTNTVAYLLHKYKNRQDTTRKTISD